AVPRPCPPAGALLLGSQRRNTAMVKERSVGRGVRALTYALIASSTLVCTAPSRGWGMLAPAQEPAATAGRGQDRAADMKTVQTALESKVVRERLKALGMS